jgi:hypothetical protein
VRAWPEMNRSDSKPSLVIPAQEAVIHLQSGWIRAVRPSRPRCARHLRMSNPFNAIRGLPHAEGARRARLEARTAFMQRCIRSFTACPGALPGRPALAGRPGIAGATIKVSIDMYHARL